MGKPSKDGKVSQNKDFFLVKQGRQDPWSMLQMLQLEWTQFGYRAAPFKKSHMFSTLFFYEMLIF